MYKACSVSKVPKAFYCVVGGTDCNRSNMQQMVRQPVNHVI